MSETSGHHGHPGGSATEALLQRDRLIVGSCLLLISLLSWWYLLTGAGTGMSIQAMTTWEFPPPLHASAGSSWPVGYWLVMAVMWWVMMIAMMVPSAAPIILLYARVQRHHARAGPESGVVAPTAMFLLGYLSAWLAFSLVATALQWLLEQLGLVHGMLMWSTSAQLSGLFLLAAGIYQLSPLKRVCLAHCRSPASVLAGSWPKHRPAAWGKGLHHGLYCVGCCWFLMLLLFVGGAMNLVWIAGLAILVLLEKLLPVQVPVAWISALPLLIGGVYLLNTL